MNIRVATVAFSGAVLGILVGIYAGKALLVPNPPITGYITIDGQNLCTQHKNSPTSQSDAFPNVNAPGFGNPGDTISWRGSATGITKVVVQFPQGSPDDPGTPFKFTGTNLRRTDFGDGDDSGPAYVSASKKFPFYSVQVGDKTCSNPGSMGVQVTK